MSPRGKLLVYAATLLVLAAALIGRLLLWQPPAEGALALAARTAWGVVQLGLLAFCFRSAVELHGQPLSAEAKFFGLWLIFPGLWDDFQGRLPGASALALVLVLLAFRLVRMRRHAAAGVLLAAALWMRPILAWGACWSVPLALWRLGRSGRGGLARVLGGRDMAAALAVAVLLGVPGSAAAVTFLWPAAMLGWEAWARSCPGVRRRLGGCVWWGACGASLATLAPWPAGPLPPFVAGALLFLVVVFAPQTTRGFADPRPGTKKERR